MLSYRRSETVSETRWSCQMLTVSVICYCHCCHCCRCHTRSFDTKISFNCRRYRNRCYRNSETLDLIVYRRPYQRHYRRRYRILFMIRYLLAELYRWRSIATSYDRNQYGTVTILYLPTLLLIRRGCHRCYRKC